MGRCGSCGADANISDSALCTSRRPVQVLGEGRGVPISPIDSIVADGKGGFWLEGRPRSCTGVTVSQTYP
jgi:hypothetical protein